MTFKSIINALAMAGLIAPATTFATNGMNMEGYGAIAAGMGGAAYAYDNGTAAMMNNPATLGLKAEGQRIDIALGFLGPDVKTSTTAATIGSSADAFAMPAFGWVNKHGKATYGFGIYGQGGMGTEYANGSVWGRLSAFSGAAGSVTDPGFVNRSEVGVGRAIFPLAYQADDRLTLGGSIDYVWAGMDIKWLIDGAHFADMMPTAYNAGATRHFGTVSGSLIDTFGGMMPASINDVSWGYFDFSNNNKFTGAAQGNGFAGKLGLVYAVDPGLTLGLTYHGKTSISDMQTGHARIGFSVNGTGVGVPAGQNIIYVNGKITVRDFQWPETFGAGLAWHANGKLLLVADYKRINWSDAMKNFRMTFNASGDNTGLASGFNNTVMDMTYYQDWKNQDVYMLGMAYQYTDALALRAGLNLANNPVPDAYVSPLFPAIIRNHLTLGAGYAFDKASSMDFSFTHAGKIKVTNNWAAVAGASGTANQTITHSQISWQAIYSRRYY